VTTTNNIVLKSPIRLETDRAWRTYLGGSMISALHGEVGEDGHFPEEWLMSTVPARNAGREHIIEGLTRIAGFDLTLAQLLQDQPEAMLGSNHVAKYKTNPGVLVKLLDAAERLTLQVHPTREKALELFGSPFGKTECWHILDCRTIEGQEPCIYMGFREGVTRAHWEHCFHTQDISAMLACLHKIPVKKGDTFIVRGGVPHGIGAGCFLVEIQEPTDYTIRTERTTPSGLAVADSMCHQGLGFTRMFDCFNYAGASLDEILAHYQVTPIEEVLEGCTLQHIIYPEVTNMFALDLVTVTGHATLNSGTFSGIYVLEGSGQLAGQPIARCDHFFLPAACSDLSVTADPDAPLKFLRFFGPQ